MSELGQTLVQDARRRLVEAYPAQVREALEALDDDELWWSPNPGANSVGNLLLHLVGSTRFFLGRGVGGRGYTRDREAEFSGRVSRRVLLQRLDETVEETASVLDALEPEALLDVSDRAGRPETLLALLLRVTHHWSLHCGQILFAVKALKEGSLEDVWRRTMR